jgi:hypothetical protein
MMMKVMMVLEKLTEFNLNTLYLVPSKFTTNGNEVVTSHESRGKERQERRTYKRVIKVSH